MVFEDVSGSYLCFRWCCGSTIQDIFEVFLGFRVKEPKQVSECKSNLVQHKSRKPGCLLIKPFQESCPPFLQSIFKQTSHNSAEALKHCIFQNLISKKRVGEVARTSCLLLKISILFLPMPRSKERAEFLQTLQAELWRESYNITMSYVNTASLAGDGSFKHVYLPVCSSHLLSPTLSQNTSNYHLNYLSSLGYRSGKCSFTQ